MRHFKLFLKNENAVPELTAYLRDDPLEKGRAFPAVLICPGGAYERCSPREAEPIAVRYIAAGFHAFVLNYSTGKAARFPTALEELCGALALIRQNAGDWRVDPGKIAVLGFSAGGHLAGSLGVFWNTPEFRRADALNKPNALILCYPVVSSGAAAHTRSFDNLCGGDSQLRERVSLEKRVNGDVPPTFLWHTAEDASVPVANSLCLAQALDAGGIPFEFHVFQRGQHGISMANAEVCDPIPEVGKYLPEWLNMSVDWLKTVFAD
ncbi:MAG: alpha/beta hydrolase [Oscillospiraceae bacterium]|jgi:acetyl esterase/lipase|nr:alpha/beta hydrolase [Oscillospiraceae bacterium]